VSAWRGWGSLLAELAVSQRRQHLRVAFPGDQGGQHGPAGDAEDVGGDRVQLDAGVLQGLVDPLGLGGVGLDQLLAVAAKVAQLTDRRCGTKLPRSSPGSSNSANQAASATSGFRPGRSLTWRALTSSSANPRASSTYQIGFQCWPVASSTTWVTPSTWSLEPVGQRLQVGAEGGKGADRLPAVAAGARIRGAHARHHLLGGHVQPGAALHQQIHHRHLP
jgi:hypothetical protein